ncbi:MAG TPA: CDP-alcohol phosphatidyltransferase family protein, partial [Myxococcota bacterium]|nr:CDP-alcohol phosphatidyltransferase family protein [Myxococcota bacterium]
MPNALSAARLLAVPVLAVLAALGRETAFTWVLIPALLSDIADGLVARMYGLESRLGAMLDSVADSLLMIVSLYGLWTFYPEVVTGHAWLIGVAVGLWVLEDVLALARYGRLSSFHTYLSKIVANLLGFFIGWLFLFGFEPWMLYVAMGASIVASLEEIALVAQLPTWRADVRGLWWVWREGRV